MVLNLKKYEKKAIRNSNKLVGFFNLDVIIVVSLSIKSKAGWKSVKKRGKKGWKSAKKRGKKGWKSAKNMI